MYSKFLWIGLFCFLIATQSNKAENWAYSNPAPPQIPKVLSNQKVTNPIDNFVLSKLEKGNLTFSTKASKTVLIRRLYFDLIGLPPSWEDVQKFINNSDPGAYEKLVDKLLSDKRYGERWAKYWLDLARYADTAGYEGDPDLPHAWRYRDYVIDSLNNNKSYDLFIKEQIAGDEFAEIMGAGELPLPNAEQIVALTFLRLAPFTEPRGDETRHEMLSEMTSTVGSVFLGLTMGCAKCHDHKYDKIPIKDFYRMKAFFSTIQIPPPERGDGFQIGGSLSAEFYKNGSKDYANKKREEINSISDQLDELSTKLKSQIKIETSGFGIQSLNAPSGNNYFYGLKNVSNNQRHIAMAQSDGQSWTFRVNNLELPQGSLAGKNNGDWIGDVKDPQYISLGKYLGGKDAQTQDGHQGMIAELHLYDHPLSSSERNALSDYFSEKYSKNPTEESPNIPVSGLQFWLDAQDLDADPLTPNPLLDSRVNLWKDKVSGISLTQENEQLQPKVMMFPESNRVAIKFDNDVLKASIKSGSYNFINNQKGSLVILFTATHQREGYGFEVGGNNSFWASFINPTAENKDSNLDTLILNDQNISQADKEKYRDLKTASKFAKQNLKRLEPKAMSLRHSFGPPYEPGVPTSRIMLRGEYDNPGEIVKAGFPSIITGNQNPAPIRLDPFKRWPTRSRRMALANWIASKNNPLTARVMVNRLWYWHFGQGIVRTPSDFGVLSGGPSHPELLDWLAIEFMNSDWKWKHIHKLIVMSSTYRQSSNEENLRAYRLDPDNRLLWKFTQKRLDAEAIRDSILSVSGRLNLEQFGLPIFPPLPDDIEETVKYSTSKWNTQRGHEGRKRSIYIYQQRTLTMPFMQTFDSLVCEESRPKRESSTTPLQALSLYNGAFTNLESSFFAQRILQQNPQNNNAQIQQAFQIALSRNPTKEELDHLFVLMENSDIPDTESLCRILLNTNEFIYVD